MRGGPQPELLHDGGWQQAPLWQHPVYPVIIYGRAAAERLAASGEEIPRRISTGHDIALAATE